jgi:hypothetical protein
MATPKRTITVRILGIALLIMMVVGTGPSSVASRANQAVEGLFTDSATETAVPRPHDPTIVRTRLVNINYDLLGAADCPPEDESQIASLLILNLFEDVVFTALLDRAEVSSSSSFSWIGHLEEVEYSQVILIVKDRMMVGNIAMPEAFYQVRYAGNGVHSIYEIDQAAFPPEAEPLPVDTSQAGFVGATDRPMADDGSIIDVMVVYTADARVGAGGTTAMQLLIDLAIAETNQSYQNSLITQRLNLVHREEVSYTESGDIDTDLGRLTNSSDGYMDNVHTLRDTHLADVVSLTVENGGGYCGIAWMMGTVSPSFESSAFSVIMRTCATGYYSFGHELGHNMGARHDWYVDDTVGSPYTYNHGYVNAPDLWRTIMAYNSECEDQGASCTRLQYWSNPDVTYGGDPLGVPEGTSTACTEGNLSNPPCDADNRKTLDNTAYTVANFRSWPPLDHLVFLPLVMKNYGAAAGWVTIVSEDFEGAFPGPWDVDGYDGYWWGRRNCRPYQGSYSGWAVGGGPNGAALACGSNYPNDAESWMIYGPFSLVGATAADLQFKLWLKTQSGYDGVCRLASTNGAMFYGWCSSGDSGGWIDMVLDLSNVPTLGNLLGQPEVWVALVFDSNYTVNYSEGGYVDNIVLRKYMSASGPVPPAIGLESVPDGAEIADIPRMMVREE